MGQLLIVQDASETRVRSLLERSCALFAALCGLEPLDRRLAGSVGVVKFPRLVRGSTGIAVDPAGTAWVAGVGTWFLDDRDPAAALAELNRRLHEERRGPDRVLGELDGSYVLAAGRDGSPSVTLVTDRVGTLHAYEAQIGSSRVISTSSMVLAVLASPEWDTQSCAEFLATGTVFEDRTLFRGLRKLEPACVYEFRPGESASPVRYWKLADVAWTGSGEPGTVAKLAGALQDSLKTVTRTYSRPVMDLTGGLDSRALLGAMLRAGLRIDTVVNGTPGHPDVTTANALARRFDLSHRHQTLPADWARRWWSNAKRALPLCDGEYDLLEYARILENHRRLAADFELSLNGSGGEFCKGYWWELLLPFIGSTRPLDEPRLAAGRFATDSWSDGLLVEGVADAEHFAEVIRRANRGLENLPNTARMDNVYLVLRMQRWQGRIASATNRIWPCASPFMFRRPMEVAFSAPPRTRVRNRMSRRLIEHLSPPLAAMPLAQGYPALPLRPGTAHRFLPLARQLLDKVWNKLVPAKPSRRPAPSQPSRLLAEMLSKEDEIVSLLTPGEMATREIFEPRRLEEFVASVRAGSVAEARLGRILTLEYLGHALRRSGGG